VQKLGATPVGSDRVEFRVWAPGADAVAVRVRAAQHELERADDGTWSRDVYAGVGDDYDFVVDGAAWPDPCSRSQPEGLHGPSRVVDTASFEIAPALELPLEELVLYELHVGTFSSERTFDGVVPRLPELRELGVTAIELMPVATFPGNRNWGYDGVYTFAPHHAYGGPEGLARLVDAAHREGLAVILDVVYNHVGPGAEALAAVAPYYDERVETFWGPVLDYAKRGVREWAIQNAELWTRDYRFDGLRIDAVHAVVDRSDPHVLKELRDRVVGIVISEMNHEGLRPLDEWGHDAMWLDNLHHELHVLLTGERRALYESSAPSTGLCASCSALGRSASSCARRTTTRSATERSATGCRRTSTASRSRACSSRSARRSCSWARSTTSATRSRSSPTTLIAPSPTRRAKDACARF
jgi:maltooligosyltrehalose trehalohydrolase